MYNLLYIVLLGNEIAWLSIKKVKPIRVRQIQKIPKIESWPKQQYGSDVLLYAYQNL